jgi:hypothetical protein
MYNNNSFEEVNSYKYIIINLHNDLSWNYIIKKNIQEDYNTVEDNCKSTCPYLWHKKKHLFEILITPIILYNI